MTSAAQKPIQLKLQTSFMAALGDELSAAPELREVISELANGFGLVAFVLQDIHSRLSPLGSFAETLTGFGLSFQDLPMDRETRQHIADLHAQFIDTQRLGLTLLVSSLHGFDARARDGHHDFDAVIAARQRIRSEAISALPAFLHEPWGKLCDQAEISLAAHARSESLPKGSPPRI